MEQRICCVCHKAVDEDAKTLGGRCYCEEHYVKVTHERKGVWRSGIAEIVAVLLFVVLVEVIITLAKPTLTGTPLLLTGIAMALVPAAIWMIFFYRQDRLEPEPKVYVLEVFLLGALLASALGIPLVRDLFRVQDWLAQSTLTNVLGSILVIGFVQEFLKYAAVRYSIYLSTEFDERVDGVVYGTAAGLGFAAMLNVHYVVSNAGVDLRMGMIRIAVTTLAQASFAGISGYFLGRAKFEEEPVWWLPLGVTIAAVLNGLFTFVRGEVTRVGLTVNPWNGLILATVVAVLTFIALYYLMRRANKITLAQAQGA
ncbi:MAG: PrsW family glutamic-type intramembrane protease [Chloroflexota bacterium]|nr:PrsW family glutamic-type intramembrane protease [Chloroflexota bacterium]